MLEQFYFPALQNYSVKFTGPLGD